MLAILILILMIILVHQLFQLGKFKKKDDGGEKGGGW